VKRHAAGSPVERKRFFAKKAAKNFRHGRARCSNANAPRAKSFLVLFFKKELLPFFPLPGGNAEFPLSAQ
jgi:hypothetical protein